ncbi:5-(carboxyamino)imidazole ribonucleotide synthase [Nitrogeniibacter mangrovi]|uniref:N5-carboxyaminoimidazole ribonucleotide synthase n=1 Tax=Nitrogeniibacter mangrovi TaxID=2016596 RepID=A0A6C1B4I2_9RHOO|nr:5-(carboxyamino)imidazole ribonucleotide synthase [Nitrogeniibacter mangrovi]QID18592.1 5-(carboxyamino)imidazole ribonucleotide synthase [Nitrogeniibacter mangrovi]
MSTDAILPPATLGMLGGGQLGRFFVHAAHEMGYQVWVLDPDPNSPAGQVAERHLRADYEDFAVLDRMAAECAAVTTEFENVPAATLDYLAKFIPVRPGAAAVAVCQNRIAEKTFLADNALPHGPFVAVREAGDLADVPATMFPAILKVARFGYDGKGQATVHDASEAMQAWQGFGAEACVLEKRLRLDCEVSVVLAREASGEIKVFPVAENRHRNGILDVSITPARVDEALAEQARQVAAHVATRLEYVGTLAVEFFVSDGALVVNEMAPRPHNSGHATIDASIADQYMQQVRALCGLPLADPRPHSAAVMVNLLGDLWYRAGDERAHEPDWSVLYAVPNLRLHLYGKHHARPGRKMGHFTVIDADVERAFAVAMAARRAIGIDDD